jgi:hypothetical protein
LRVPGSGAVPGQGWAEHAEQNPVGGLSYHAPQRLFTGMVNSAAQVLPTVSVVCDGQYSGWTFFPAI